jgi:hypothetical protein
MPEPSAALLPVPSSPSSAAAGWLAPCGVGLDDIEDDEYRGQDRYVPYADTAVAGNMDTLAELFG